MGIICFERNTSATAAKEQASNYGSAAYLPLRIGLSLSVALDPIAPMLAELARAFPGLALHLERGSAADMLDALKAGDLELVIAAEAPPDWDRMDCWPLFEEGFVVIAPHGHKMAGRKKLSLSDIVDETLIARPYCESVARLSAIARQGDNEPLHRHEVCNDTDLLAMARGGLAFGLLPASSAPRSGEAAVPLTDPDFTRQVHAFGVSGRQRSAAAAGLVRLLRAADWSQLNGDSL